MSYSDLRLSFISSLLRNLSTSVGSLLSLLVGFLADDWPQVSDAVLEVLKEFKQKHLNSNDSQLVEVLEENLHRTMTALPRLMRSTGEMTFCLFVVFWNLFLFKYLPQSSEH